MTNNEINVLDHHNIAVIEFGPGHKHSPFSSGRMSLLRKAISDLNTNPNIQAIVLYGGKDRSFSVGCDFNEVSNFSGGEEVEEWIETINSVYIELLSSSKPTIAAIDGYAIGFGLQLAISCDYRIGSYDCELIMPEFSKGIACIFGGYMLEKFINRSVMQKMLFECDGIKGLEAKTLGLLHKTVSSEILIEEALNSAKKFASYSPVPVRETKKTLNKEIVEELNEICKMAKEVHRKSFSVGDAQVNMKKLLNSKKRVMA